MTTKATGVNTGTIIYTRKRTARPCNCKQCRHARILDGKANCTITGELEVKKRKCKYYFKKVTKERKK